MESLASEPGLAHSKSSIETQEKCVKNVQSQHQNGVNDVVLASLLLTLNRSYVLVSPLLTFDK